MYDQAQLRAEQVLDRDPLNADARVLRYRAIGEAALSTGDQLNAEAAFRSGVEDAPHSPEAFVALAQVMADGRIVWEYVNPFFGGQPNAQVNSVFRVQRYSEAEIDRARREV